MIIKGKSRAGAGSLAAHLGNAEKNERVTTLETRGTVAHDLRGALTEMEAYAAGTRCEKSLYHAALSPEPPHRLSPTQRTEAINALEEKLGLSGHARVVVMHEKLGREHIHVVWSRIDLDRMRSVSDSHNYRKHEEVSRDLERRFGHDRVQGAHHEREGVKRPDRTPSRSELRQQERTGIKDKDVKAEVSALYKSSDWARSFATALDEAGYVLAKGDRRDFVIIDREGGVHSLARRIDGVKAAELREFMSPLNRESFPTVQQAQEIQRPHTDENRRIREEEERRKREAHADHQENKLEAAYARSDDYVTQSHAAQRDFERRQKALDKENVRDSAWDAIERGEAERQQAADDRSAEDETQRRDEDHRRKADEAARLQSPSAPTSDSDGAFDNIEITDHVARVLGDLDDGSRDKGLAEGETPDRQREAPGGGRTRSR
jgi:Relaxase/Mobilisation nuclease domain